MKLVQYDQIEVAVMLPRLGDTVQNNMCLPNDSKKYVILRIFITLNDERPTRISLFHIAFR